MDRKDSLAPKKKKSRNQMTAIVSILVAAALLAADLFVMIRMPEDNLAPVIITIVMLVGVYVFVNAILKEIRENKSQSDEQYDMLFKSGKASYLLMKKALEQLEEIENSTKIPADDLITTQKSIAKLTITRNKENALALMNSNDRLLEHILEFKEKMDAGQSELIEKNQSILDTSMNEIQAKQQEIFSSLQEMHNAIQGEVSQTADGIQENVTQAMESILNMKDELIQQNAQMKDELIRQSEQMKDELIRQNAQIKDEVLASAAFAQQNITASASVQDAPEDLSGVGEDIGFADGFGESEDIDFADGLGEPENIDFADGLGEPETEEGDIDFGDSLGESEDIDFADSLGESETEEGLTGAEDIDFADNLGEIEPETEEGLTGAEDIDFADSLGETEKIEFTDDLEEEEKKEDLSFLDDMNLEAELEAGLAESGNISPADNSEVEADSLDFGAESLGLEPEAEQEPEAETNSNVIPMTVSDAPVEEEPAKTIPSDPHKLMTPDEIAALIASM
ncbi:MAG: hypothetical protein J6K53_02935 [Roseburia sp.]|nr:hypothetical protein [Roseburia sp.]